MNPYRLRQMPVALFVVSQLALLIAFAWKDFPIFIFFFLAPIFALLDHRSGVKDLYLAFLVAIITALCFAYVMDQGRLLSWTIYFACLAVTIALYMVMQKITHDRLNKFALVFFVLGMEYILLKFTINQDPAFLADLLGNKTTWTRWNIFTGYAGTTLWILLVNLLFYNALFKEAKIHWVQLALCILLIVCPVVYSLNLTHNALTKGDVVRFYQTSTSDHSAYGQYGEFISRTGAWVSVLIIIFTLVKGKTKKVLR
jgi:apolipoprotein N-acyltransferase